jgi:hypothetical protein
VCIKRRGKWNEIEQKVVFVDWNIRFAVKIKWVNKNRQSQNKVPGIWNSYTSYLGFNLMVHLKFHPL